MDANTKPARAGSVSAGARVQYLTFLLGREVFAMDLRAAREIIPHGPITSVPMMPEFVRGIINLRGAALPVIDLQVRFGRTPAPVGDRTCIVVFETGSGRHRRTLGLQVDAVREVVDIAPGQIEPPPQFGATVRREFLQGIAKVTGRFVILLDPDTVLELDDAAQAFAAGEIATGRNALAA